MLSGKHEEAELDNHTANLIADNTSEGQEVFNAQERRMIERVLGLAQQTVSSIMTSRHDVEYLDLNDPPEKLTQLLAKICIPGSWLLKIALLMNLWELFT